MLSNASGRAVLREVWEERKKKAAQLSPVVRSRAHKCLRATFQAEIPVLYCKLPWRAEEHSLVQ